VRKLEDKKRIPGEKVQGLHWQTESLDEPPGQYHNSEFEGAENRLHGRNTVAEQFI
jgi:hypothetical protein